MRCLCCKAKNLKQDGTGLRKDGENDGALAFFKSQANKMHTL